MVVALAAPPRLSGLFRGAVSSRSHIRVTAPRGRSASIREQINLVPTIAIITAHAVEKNPNPKPSLRSINRTSRNATIPTPHATYLARHGNVAFGGPSQTASTR